MGRTPPSYVSRNVGEDEPPFPLDFEDFLRATCQVLAEQRALSEINLLASTPVEVGIEATHFNGDGDSYDWYLTFRVPLLAHTKHDVGAWEAVAGRIRGAAGRVLLGYPDHWIQRVNIVPEIEAARPDWRSRAIQYVEVGRPNNQGRVRSDNVAAIQHRGLLFRSEAEVNLFEAFKAMGVTVAPLAVFVRGGESYRRIEPDFFLVHEGVAMVVEVDGSRFHTESPVQAAERLELLRHEGVYEERVRASDCLTEAGARACAEKILAVLEKHARR